MSDYRRGAVLGLTVAETFILLTFLLLIALLGLAQSDEPPAEFATDSAPRVWVRPEEIETLVNDAKAARKAQKDAEEARATAERERDRAREKAARAAMAEEDTKQARAAAERERDEARSNLALLRRKGENPPCWYQIVNTGQGKTREKPYYAFNVAIYEESIELAPRTAPPGGALDDSDGLYADEWSRLRIEELPYGRMLSDNEFTEAVNELVAQGRNRQVRTYECVFSVMVWDITPDDAKKRWKDAHDRIVEGLFSAYTVRDLEWKGVESLSAGKHRIESERVEQ